jgi:hypothetical protein
VSDSIGIAATRYEERALAVTGTQAYAPCVFNAQESVLNAGVLFSIPSLISQGLERFFKVLNPLPAGFYGLHHIVLILCFMTLCRIKNAEQLKKHSPGEFGKLLGLDRIPEVKYFRKKVKQITDQSRVDYLHSELFQGWVESMPEMFFFIDGHVLVYHGDLANLPKRFVSREKLCLAGTTEFWVNDQKGLPLMVVSGELNEKLKTAIEQIIPKILKDADLKISTDPKIPTFTIVVDREAYEPAWFKSLWKTYRIAIITYRKNVKDKWDESLFQNTEVQTINGTMSMRLCEMGVLLNGHWFREVRKLSADGHQTAIITTHPTLLTPEIAVKMFARWTQENFFKYLIENFDFDRMIEYGTEPVNQKKEIPNPEYKKFTYQIKKDNEKKKRIEARIFKQMEDAHTLNAEQFSKLILKYSDLIEKVQAYKIEIERLKALRKTIPTKITVAQMPEEKRYNKLKQEGKKLKNAVIMLVYRAESELYAILGEFYNDNEKDGRMILKEIFESDADMIPDYENNILTVRLHSLSTPRANEVVKKSCVFLNQTETCFPHTNLIMNYETVAL